MKPLAIMTAAAVIVTLLMTAAIAGTRPKPRPWVDCYRTDTGWECRLVEPHK